MKSEVEQILESHHVEPTELRCEVLSAIISHHGSIKAYDLILKISATHKVIKPMTIYRILNLFLESGILHKIDSRSVFLLCKTHKHTASHEDTVFLVCNKCGKIQEVSHRDFGKLLRDFQKKYDFVIGVQHTEISGYCGECRP